MTASYTAAVSPSSEFNFWELQLLLPLFALTMGTIFKVIDLTIGLRVTKEEENLGLDIGEHGLESYTGFQIIE